MNNIENVHVTGTKLSIFPSLISTIRIGGGNGPTMEIGVSKKFNWFQKKMIKWCFGFEVKENKDVAI